MFVCLLDELILGLSYSDLTWETGGLELVSTITPVLLANRLTKCASHPKCANWCSHFWPIISSYLHSHFFDVQQVIIHYGCFEKSSFRFCQNGTNRKDGTWYKSLLILDLDHSFSYGYIFLVSPLPLLASNILIDSHETTLVLACVQWLKCRIKICLKFKVLVSYRSEKS